MSFIRPEARATLWRWREVLAGSVMAAIGALWAMSSFGVLFWLACGLAGLGGILVVLGVQRTRFRGAGGGAGVVQVDERQVTYYGPLSGGAVALSELGVLSLDGRATPAHWQLVPEGGGTLQIPVDAEGADALFDAFSTLPGLRTARLLGALDKPRGVHTVIWRRADVQKRVQSLH